MKRRQLWFTACALVFSGAAFAWLHQQPASNSAQALSFASCEISASCLSGSMSFFANIW